MNHKSLKTLEYTKIIDQLTEFATCPPGRELCKSLLPSSDFNDIVQSQKETTDAVTRVRMKGSLSFSGVKDIGDSLKRLEVGSSLSITELLSISSLLTVTSRAVAYGKHEDNAGEEEESDSLEEDFRLLEPLTSDNNEIKRCIISEDEISDDASPGLRHVRRSMKAVGEKIHTQLNTILNSNRTYLQDAVITMRDGRYCLPVKSEYKASVSGMVHDQSSSGSTLFIEPMAIIKLNNEMRELEIQEKKEIEAVLADLSNRLAPHIEELEMNYRLLSRLDFIFAKGALSRHYKCSEPKFNQKGYISIKDGRHPLLDSKKVVPINIYLGNAFNQLIITGPNTGGKTVSLKTVGLFTLMGQAGLHIPAFDGSSLSVFTEVFADIGDEQSIEQNLSTFSSHMTNIVDILNKADSNSLCLFDELCAGTDPTEGAALAISLLTFFHNIDCRTLATTHYSEIKVYALTTNGVENACCEFSLETLSPTYRLLIGIPGKSNAFAISKKLGLPDHIIEAAKTHMDTDDESFEDLLTHLENNRVTIEKERAEIEKYREEIEKLKSGLEKKEERLDESRDKLLRNAREEAQRILREAKETADQSIRRINKLSEDAGLSKELEAERGRIRDGLNKVDAGLSLKSKLPKKAVSPKSLHLGDGVKVLSMNLTGTVSSLPNDKGDLYVQMGILRSQVNINDIELINEAAEKASAAGSKKGAGSGSSNIRVAKSLNVSPELNLIGMTTDEAVPVLDKYLDDAYLSHLPQVRIVHGRGTGALKNAVHNHLKRLKYVDEFRLGVYGEGDTGVTIVTFK